MNRSDLKIDEKYLLMLMKNQQYITAIQYYQYIVGKYDEAINCLIAENKLLNDMIKEFC